jgi:isopentenyl-diphosphate delta-isomerase
MNDQVILVDTNDNPIGIMPKLEAHEKGQLHRAFSVFIFNSNAELLLQQRAFEKYHSGGLWSNTCCSHPAPGETINKAAPRRLLEEMGISCELKYEFNFIYKANFENGLIEHEFDHVYFGFSDATPIINKEEVNDWKYSSLSSLIDDIKKTPSHYTVWLKDCIERVIQHKAINRME